MIKMNKAKIVLHYDEIALKGNNRSYFEKALVSNLRHFFKSKNIRLEVERSWGRIFAKGDISEELFESIKFNLKRFPGISSFGLAHSMPLDMSNAEDLAKYFAALLGEKSFRVSAKRVNKSFPKSSQDFEREFGALVYKAAKEPKVSMKNFDLEFFAEILDKEILLYVKEKGLGGLPSGSSGKAVSLLSAGFDSPVASFLLQKRGVRVFPLHFHASEKTGKEPLEAVKDLSKILSEYQSGMKLAVIDVFEIQKYIAKNAPEKLRIVLIRRVFMRLSSRYAEQLGALALITGESVGQVASQTLENIIASNEAASLPVLRPLSGLNKNEIIDIARFIGTEEISSRPCEDTCSLFLPKFPETKAKMKEVLKAEENLSELTELEEKAYTAMETFNF